MRSITMALILILTTAHALALDVMTINTKFLWDHKFPHDGKIINASSAPSKEVYLSELQAYARAIKEKKVDFVGLTEIEGCHVAFDLKRVLDDGWFVACREGRDSYTGQDVAILSKLIPDDRSYYNHDKSYSEITYGPKKGKSVRPSKAFSAVFYYKDSTVVVTTAHLISRKGNNDAKREAQARAIKWGTGNLKFAFDADYEIIMGDFNDYPDSKTLQILKGDNLVSYEDASDCSYTYRGSCKLIDHILTTPNIGQKQLDAFVIDPRLKDDHRAVYIH